MPNENGKPLVQVKHLKKYFKAKKKGSMLHAVDDVSFEIYPGETLGLVGESGCGKSTVGNVLMRLHDATGGEFLFDGRSVFDAKREEHMQLCRDIQIVFQDPYSSINPKKTVRQILAAPYIIHKLASGEELEQKIRRIAAEVGLSEDYLDRYPHELDGGKRQIVGIARALSLDPKFVVCDEPVSSLDVSIQATIINLLMDIQKKKNLAYLFVSHDLSVVRHISNRIAVMYLGQIVEIAETDELFANAQHPYTLALLSAVPRIDMEHKISRILLKGDVPSPVDPPENCCRFAARCWMASEKCTQEVPPMTDIGGGHCVACHFYQDARRRAESAEKSTERPTAGKG